MQFEDDENPFGAGRTDASCADQRHGFRLVAADGFHHLGDEGLGGVSGLDDVLVTGGEYVHTQGVLAVELGEAGGVDKAVVDGGDITQQQAGAVGPGAQHDVFEILLYVGLAHGAQHDLAVLGAHGTGRNIQ